MCFNITDIPVEVKFNLPKPLIAEEDIVCYKIVRKNSKGKIISDSRDYEYNTTTTQPEINLEIKLGSTWINNEKKSTITGTIEEGYHSYTNINKAYSNLTSSRGLLSMICYIDINDSENRVLVRFYIPKGSKYYINEKEQEYVSSNIKFDEVIEDKLLIRDPKFN